MTLELSTLGWIVFTIVVVGFFTDFYGLGSRWQNRGHWYDVDNEEQLKLVIKNLHKLKAFQDSDGLNTGIIKMEATPTHYRVKVPHWVFKEAEISMNYETRFNLLGLTATRR